MSLLTCVVGIHGETQFVLGENEERRGGMEEGEPVLSRYSI
jgi:hypothetical protein